jgi:hypothetical protein
MRLQVCTGALQQGRGRANKPWAGVEAAMSLRLDHGSVVRTFKHTVVLLQVRDFAGMCVFNSCLTDVCGCTAGDTAA